MKFNKIININITGNILGEDYWKLIDDLTEKRVNVSADDPNLMSELQDADCVLLDYGIPFVKDHFDAAPNLKYIGVLATAYDKVDIKEAKERKVIVTNLPGYSTESVAEFIIAAILENMRQLSIGQRSARQGDFDISKYSVSELKNKNFAILGLGAIGKRVAEIALGFNSNVHYWSQTRKSDMEDRGLMYQEVDSLIKEADIISANFAAAEDNKNFFDQKRLSLIKPGAIFIHTIPLETIDIDALIARLKLNDITFIFDHLNQTTPEQMAELTKLDNCISYPSIAFNSKEAHTAMQEMFVKNMESFLQGSPENYI